MTRDEIHAEALGYGIDTLRPGQRVELHAATDWYMRGARYGEIVAAVTGAGERAVYRVQLDKVTKPARIASANVRPISQGIR